MLLSFFFFFPPQHFCICLHWYTQRIRKACQELICVLCCLHFRRGILYLKREKSACVIIKIGQCTFFKEEKYLPLCISCGGFTNTTTYKHLVQSKSNDSICILHYIRKHTTMYNIYEQWKEKLVFSRDLLSIFPLQRNPVPQHILYYFPVPAVLPYSFFKKLL